MACLRHMIDMRQVPVLIGAIQVLWALALGGLDSPGKTMYTILEVMSVGDEWVWIMGLSGVYLIVGGLFSRRETLTIGLMIGAVIWTTMCIMAFHHWYWYSPEHFITISILSMPLYASALWCSFFREVYLKPAPRTSERPQSTELRQL